MIVGRLSINDFKGAREVLNFMAVKGRRYDFSDEIEKYKDKIITAFIEDDNFRKQVLDQNYFADYIDFPGQ